jgi:hypothetical protein
LRLGSEERKLSASSRPSSTSPTSPSRAVIYMACQSQRRAFGFDGARCEDIPLWR